MVTVRFAPAPSGNLHPGGLRVFLFNLLFAKKNNGRFIIRFEDTDPRISFSEYQDSLFQSLNSLGIDESFEIFEQSSRHEIYHKAALELVRVGKAYPCFCTRDDLLQRLDEKGFSKQGELVRYDGHCRNLSPDDISKRLDAGLQPAYRLKVENRVYEIEDLIKSRLTFDTSQIGDFIILRSNGTGLYNFACVVDDLLMGITHVIRGEDQLVNTPKQLLIYDALAAPPPRFANLPLLLGSTGEKYSKRTKALSLFQLLRKGILPNALINYLYFMGYRGDNNPSILTLDEMAKDFDFGNISKSYCRFDLKKAEYFNGLAIKKRENESLLMEVEEYLRSAGLIKEPFINDNNSYLPGLISELKTRYKTLVDLSTAVFSIINDTPLLDDEAKEYLTGTRDKTLQKINVLINTENFNELKETVLNNNSEFGPIIRTAIQGTKSGLPLTTLLKVLPEKLIRQRLIFINNFLHTDSHTSQGSGLTFEEINENRVKYYFEKKFNIKVERTERLNGLRNISCRVLTDKGSFIMKRSLFDSFFNLYREKIIMQTLGPLQISPDKPFLDLTGSIFSEPLLIYREIKGSHPEDVDNSFLKAVSQTLVKILKQNVPDLPPLPHFSLKTYWEGFKDQHRRFEYLRESEGIGSDKFSTVLNEYILSIEDTVKDACKYWQSPFPFTIVHGDVRPSNVIINEEGKAALIDWEEGAPGDPAFEISWFFVTNKLNPAQETYFLKHYLPSYNEILPFDQTFQNRLDTYNLINRLYFVLGSSIHCLELSKGLQSISYPLEEYLKRETEENYKGFASAFSLLNEDLKLNKEPITCDALKESGRLLLKTPVLPKESIIVIDGLSSTGKSIAAPEAARRLNYLYVNLGAIFRGLSLYLDSLNVKPDSLKISQQLSKTNIEYVPSNSYPHFSLKINGRDMTGSLYSEKAERLTPFYAGDPVIINYVKSKVNSFRKNHPGLVIEGRKAGVEFYPDADYKFFLTLDEKERVRLKSEQLKEEEHLNQNVVKDMLQERDEKDFQSQGYDDMEQYVVISQKIFDAGRLLSEIFDHINLNLIEKPYNNF